MQNTETLISDHWKFYSAVYLASEFLAGIIQAYLGNHKAEQLLFKKKQQQHKAKENGYSYKAEWYGEYHIIKARLTHHYGSVCLGRIL